MSGRCSQRDGRCAVSAIGALVLGLALLAGSCEGAGRLRSSLEWLAEVNRYYGSLVRAYGDEGHDSFVAIIEPTSNVLPEGYLAVGHSDSWGQGSSSLWIVAIDPRGTVQSQFYFDNAGGVTIVDAGRSETGRDGPDSLVALGNLDSAPGSIALAVMPMEDLVAYGAPAPAASISLWALDATDELAAVDLHYTDRETPVIAGASGEHPMIMKLTLDSSPPTIVWQKQLTELQGSFVSCIGLSSGDLLASGSVERPGDRNVLLCRFDAATGAPVWALELGSASSDEEGGALLWMDISGENLALVGSASEDYPNGWVFHSVTADGELRASKLVDIVLPDYDPNPPRSATEYWPIVDDGFALFVGTEATVMAFDRSDDPFWAARRDTSPDSLEYELEYIEPVTISASWRGLIHAGSMPSMEFPLSVNDDGMVLWPLEGDGTSYPANRSAPPSTLDISPDPPPVTFIPDSADLDAVVSELSGWELLRDTYPSTYEY